MITVTAAIIRKGDTVLLTRRKQGQRMAGYWEFPGGKLEEGETLQACLEREILEELGWKIQAGEIVATNIHSYERGDIYLVAMDAVVLSGYRFSPSMIKWNGSQLPAFWNTNLLQPISPSPRSC